MVNQSHSKWLRATLQVHTGHLMNSPQCGELLGPIYAMLEARTKHYSSLLQLKGKLDIMTKQISAKAEATNASDGIGDESAVAKFGKLFPTKLKLFYRMAYQIRSISSISILVTESLFDDL